MSTKKASVAARCGIAFHASGPRTVAASAGARTAGVRSLPMKTNTTAAKRVDSVVP